MVVGAAVVLVVLGTIWLIIASAREDDRERQACAAHGGTMKRTGTHIVSAGKVLVPVPKYACRGAAR